VFFVIPKPLQLTDPSGDGDQHRNLSDSGDKTDYRGEPPSHRPVVKGLIVIVIGNDEYGGKKDN
jgi:hypothetical protein